MANLKITLVKSTIGAVPKHKKTVEALGLRKLNKTVVLPDNAATRGTVCFLVYWQICTHIFIIPKKIQKSLSRANLDI